MKWLAVDYGDSRTGLAGCDAGETITSPITPQIEEKSMNKVAAAVTEVLTARGAEGLWRPWALAVRRMVSRYGMRIGTLLATTLVRSSKRLSSTETCASPTAEIMVWPEPVLLQAL